MSDNGWHLQIAGNNRFMNWIDISKKLDYLADILIFGEFYLSRHFWFSRITEKNSQQKILPSRSNIDFFSSLRFRKMYLNSHRIHRIVEEIWFCENFAFFLFLEFLLDEFVSNRHCIGFANVLTSIVPEFVSQIPKSKQTWET